MVAASVPLLLLLLLFVFSLRSSASPAPLCPRSDLAFVDSLRSQCPLRLHCSSPIEVSGETLHRELKTSQSGVYFSVLFYSSWCPFSSNTRPTFDALNSMFPQIRHLAVEELSAMPSVFSRYGICSFPSILLANQTMMVRYHGSKGISSLVEFYRETTGLDPVYSLAVDKPADSPNLGTERPWDGSLQDIILKEPYLALALLFVCLKVFAHILSDVFAHIKVFWVSYTWPLNFGLFGESRQLLGCVLQAIDMKQLWSKFRLSNKTTNFGKGTTSARVWASTLTSVSARESFSKHF